MRTILGVTVGVAIMIIWHALGWPWIGWVLTRIPPSTPDGWAPRYRDWTNGTEVKPWQPTS